MSVRSSGPAGLQLRPVLLGCSISLGTTASFSGLSKARVHYVPARPCQLITVSCCFLYLDHPLCAISCVNHLIAYYSQKIIPLKLNYNIYNKKLLVTNTVLKE